jgi:hypothetical protein
MNLYLIQRGKIEDRPHKKGLDSIILLDYMGSSEFENGAIPISLKTIRKSSSAYVYSDFTFGSKTVTVFCNASVISNMKDILKNLINGNYHLLEYCDFIDWINDDKYKPSNDFWWDLKNNFMFWKQNKNFETKFKELISTNPE